MKSSADSILIRSLNQQSSILMFFRPVLRVYSTITLKSAKDSIYRNHSQLIHECYGKDFICDFWKCKNGDKIPSIGVCNGTKDCSDGTDEAEILCEGDHTFKANLILGILISYVTTGILCYLGTYLTFSSGHSIL